MTDVNLDQLPPKFGQIHYKQIDRWLSRYLCGKAGPVFQVIPREPLGPVSDGVSSATVCVVELMLSDQHVDGDRVLYVLPRNPASQILMEAWAAQYANTTQEQFDWHPFSEAFA